jgi:hypothetical protein
MSNHGDRKNNTEVGESCWGLALEELVIISSAQSMVYIFRPDNVDRRPCNPPRNGLVGTPGAGIISLRRQVFGASGTFTASPSHYLPIQVSRDRLIAHNLLTGEAVRGSDGIIGSPIQHQSSSSPVPPLLLSNPSHARYPIFRIRSSFCSILTC